jgi:UDP-N-acetylglucosamine--N-acetylmuramyl-(pentapeptide) pyrophosphoryl-undecaprenol N-acetylglucosamine transferase
VTLALAAAGTGGHVYPALAVADELHRRGHNRNEITFFGGDRLEATAVPEAGYPFVRLRLQGFKRSVSPENLSIPFVVAGAARDVTRMLRERGARAVLAFGGYVTVPVAIAARRCGVPLLIHEQNAAPGLANRMAARWAARVLVAFPEAAQRMPRAEIAGTPLRDSIVRFDRDALRRPGLKRYGLDDTRKVLGVLGGSLGAAVLNETTAAIAANWRGVTDVAILHLCGPDHLSEMKRRAEGSQLPWAVLPFEDSMEYFYAVSDLVLSRAGAITVSELAATATPAVLVPLEAVAQEHNAAYLAEAGGAVVVEQSNVGTIPDWVEALMADASGRAAMGACAARAARPEATTVVVDALEAAAGG